MAAYYNEFDPFAAEWLRKLIDAGLIAPGIVDERSIADVEPEDIKGFTQCHFFAGIGGWSYALRLAGIPDDYPCWTGSPPCQPFSLAGKQLGNADDRHLAPIFMRLISECSPPILFGEQVAAAINKHWLDDLFDELEEKNYACSAAVLPAAGIGAPHKRERLFFAASSMAYTNSEQFDGGRKSRAAGRLKSTNLRTTGFWSAADWLPCRDGKLRQVEPGTFPLADGVPARVGRLRGYGNSIVPQIAAEFIAAFMESLREVGLKQNPA